MSNDLLMLEQFTRLKSNEFGSVSLNTSGDGLYKVIIFNINKTHKNMVRNGETARMSFEDAMELFAVAEKQVVLNRDSNKNKVSLGSLRDAFKAVEGTVLSVVNEDNIAPISDDDIKWEL